MPLTDETKNMINKNNLSNMKKVLVNVTNTARGGVINEKTDLNDALNKKNFGAGIDVFES